MIKKVEFNEITKHINNIFHDDMPIDYIILDGYEIVEMECEQRDDGGWQIVKSLSDLKNVKISELNDSCNKAVLGRFKATIYDAEYEFSYDYDAQLRFTGIGVLFNANKINEIEWTAYLNNERVRITLNQDNFDAVTLAALYHQNYNVTKFNQLLQQVNSATTKEQIEAIVW